LCSVPPGVVLSSIFFWLLAIAATSCATRLPSVSEVGSGDSGPGLVSSASPAIFPAPFRLPDTTTPLSYELALSIDPANDRFEGNASIEVELTTPTSLIRLHADGLTIGHASFTRAGVTTPLTPHLDGKGALALVSDDTLARGRATLTLSWTGPLDEPPVGLYHAKEGEHFYAYTQFEPLEARKAFPCFDEPRFKTPWTVSLTAPATATSLSNMPETATALVSDPARAGWRRTSFATSPPMPTYLVAFAVGPFDIVDGPKVSSRRVPFRVVTTKGKGHLARFALERTGAHMDFLERYFDIPYPYAKLDFVAVPSFSSSAMENVGLVTYRDAVLLIDPERAPLDDRLRGESIISHELAHMWFGNLVTLAWWDDLWLNEAFAVWMSRKGVAALAPEHDMGELVVRGKFNVMSADSRPAARAIRQPILADGDIYNAFDGITYSKGASVLEMLERWIGEDVFRAGVRSYLLAHAHGVATTADLVDHLEAAAAATNRRGDERMAIPTGAIARVLASFTDKPHVPLVSLDWRCEAGKVTLELAQREWRSLTDPRGPTPDVSPEGGLVWDIPMCARLSNGLQTQTHCGLLTRAKDEWETTLPFCPTFSHPNEHEAGYFRWETRLGPVSIARQEPLVFAGYLGNLRGAFEAGRLDVVDYLDLVAPLVANNLSPSALGDVLGALGVVGGALPDVGEDPRFIKRAKAWIGKMPLDLSFGSSLRDRRIQPMLVRTFAGLKDKGVLAESARVTSRFLAALAKGPAAKESDFDLERANVYLPIHVRDLGHEPRLAKAREALWTALERGLDTPNPSVRNLVIQSLGAFQTPELAVRSLELVVSGRLRAQDFRTVRAWLSGRPEVASAVWTWLTTRFEPLVEKLGTKSAPTLPYLAGGFCVAERADEVQRWFEARAAIIPSGLDRNLASVVDGIRACAVSRAHHAEAARRWYLGGRPRSTR